MVKVHKKEKNRSRLKTGKFAKKLLVTAFVAAATILFPMKDFSNFGVSFLFNPMGTSKSLDEKPKDTILPGLLEPMMQSSKASVSGQNKPRPKMRLQLFLSPDS